MTLGMGFHLFLLFFVYLQTMAAGWNAWRQLTADFSGSAAAHAATTDLTKDGLAEHATGEEKYAFQSSFQHLNLSIYIISIYSLKFACSAGLSWTLLPRESSLTTRTGSTPPLALRTTLCRSLQSMKSAL